MAVDVKNEVRAEAKWVRTSARKARLVADLIRGRSVPEARTVLAFTQRAAALDVEKVLRSAVANAEVKHPGTSGDDYYVSAIVVDEGPTIKRHRPRARGRVARILKRTCHITINIAQADGSVRRATAPAQQPKAKAQPRPTTEKPKRAPRRKKAEEAKA